MNDPETKKRKLENYQVFKSYNNRIRRSYVNAHFDPICKNCSKHHNPRMLICPTFCQECFLEHPGKCHPAFMDARQRKAYREKRGICK